MGIEDDIIQIEHEGVIYSAATNAFALRIGPLVDLIEIMGGDHDPDDLTYQMRVLSLISSIPLDVVERMDFARFCQLAELLTFDALDLPSVVTAEDIGQGTNKAPSKFYIEGIEEPFSWQPHYAFGCVRDLARVEDLLKGRDLMLSLHYILALLAYREGEIFDMDAINEKAQLMCKAKAKDVFKQLLFFCSNDASSSIGFTSFLARVKAKAERSKRSSKSGDGPES